MEHNFRWLKTRLNLDTLESRMQPGSILSSGLDVGVAAEVLARPENSATRQIKKLEDSQDIQIVAGRVDNQVVATQRVTAPSSSETQRPATPLGNNNVSKPSINPVVNQQNETNKSAQPVTLQQHLESKNLEVITVPLQQHPNDRTTVAFTGGQNGQVQTVTMDNVKVEQFDCGSGDLGRTLDGTLSEFVYADGGVAGVTRIFGNAGGRGGANLGTQYIVGSRAGDGLVIRVPDLDGDGDDACTAMTLDAGATPVQFNDAHATAGGLIVVGTADLVDDAGLFGRLNPTTLAVTSTGPNAGFWAYAGAGIDVRLLGTATRIGGPAIPDNVAVSGELFDKGSATGFSFNAVWDEALTVGESVPQVNFTFNDIETNTVPVDCKTNALDMDRGGIGGGAGNSYLSIQCDETASPTLGYTNVFARINAAHSSTADILYAVTLWDQVGFSAMPAGNLGARLLQGSAPASGMRTVGSFELTGANPGVLSSLNVKWTDLSNPAGPAFTGAFWGVTGADFYGEDVAVQRPETGAPAQEFVATPIGLPGDHGAFLIQYDDGFDDVSSTGATGFGFDVAGTDEIAYGADTLSGAALQPIYLAGSNAGDLGAGSHCDIDHNGGLDGFGSTFGNSLPWTP